MYPAESSVLDMVSRLFDHTLCVPNLLINGIRYEGCRENRHEYSRKSVSVIGIGTPNRELTLRCKVSWETSTLGNREYQWRLEGAVTLKLFEVLIELRSDHLLHY